MAPFPTARRRMLPVAVAFIIAFAALILGAARSGAQTAPGVGAPRPLVPEFPPGSAWLNTERPLTLRGLRGKVVLLDFWTYGCINCMHILPDLKRLERKYADELVIVSVHTAKFPNEDETQNIRSAVLRYNIEHPILNDSGRRYWTALGVQIWPTLVLIDPAGRLVGMAAGEGHFEDLDRAIARTIREARTAGRLDSRPLRLALEAAKTNEAPLSFPGKVLADLDAGGSGRLYIADSNHNRIIIANAKGEVEAVAGTGEAGRGDGAFHEATFSNPQGMALRRAADGSLSLLVADTNNHTIRSLDLARGRVSTLAGTGKQAPVTRRVPGGVGTQTALASPWDLLLVGKTLYIAMAGPHQIWTMDLDTSVLRPYAGSGREARLDGPLRAAAFAQPSGLATDGRQLFVADSESSTIRAVDLPGTGGRVRTLTAGDLFLFGDQDGPGATARLQHPLGVAVGDGSLYIADTYNHKIKRLDLASGQVETFLGGGRGAADGKQPRFYEPGGISLAGKRLYIADTNNHRICVADVETGISTTLALKNLPASRPAEPDRSPSAGEPEQKPVDLPRALLAPSAAGELAVAVKLPPGHKLSAESPHRFTLALQGTGLTLGRTTVPATEVKLPLRVPLTTTAAGAQGEILVTLTLFYCAEGEGACKMKTGRFRVPFEVRDGGAKTLTVPWQL